MELSSDQLAAKAACTTWFNAWHAGDHEQQIFRIFGYAGTGKTTAVKDIVKDLHVVRSFDEIVEISGEVQDDDIHQPAVIISGAYTGKAALVMTRAGLPARTLHSLIYIPIIPDKGACAELKTSADDARKAGNKELAKAYSDQLAEASQLGFELNPESLLYSAHLLVLDECSMVNDEMMNDILSFDIPILVLGDSGQLPPIKGTGALIRDKPDIMFTQIHRQALENPIINLSMRAREGLSIPLGEHWGGSSHIPVASATVDAFKAFDQIIVGKNKTRREFNLRMRGILGFAGTYPVEGDKLICLRNKREMNLFNGLICTVKEVLDEYDETIEMLLTTELETEVIVKALKCHFDEYVTPGTVEQMQWWDFQRGQEFDFGYAITVHKSQGSQWDHVGFYDDKMLMWDKPARRKWLYTGITRASETITIMS